MTTKSSPAFVLLTEAVRLTSVSRRTIDRDIKNGKIHQSQVQKDRNRKKISVAELERVYGQLNFETETETETKQDKSPKLSKTDQDILDILKEQLEEERARSRKAEEQVQEWQDRYLGAQEKLNGFLLPAPPPAPETPPPPKKKGLFRNWFRNKKG